MSNVGSRPGGCALFGDNLLAHFAQAPRDFLSNGLGPLCAEHGTHTPTVSYFVKSWSLPTQIFEITLAPFLTEPGPKLLDWVKARRFVRVFMFAHASAFISSTRAELLFQCLVLEMTRVT